MAVINIIRGVMDSILFQVGNNLWLGALVAMLGVGFLILAGALLLRGGSARGRLRGPLGTLLAGVALIVGLGVFQRLSATVEREAGERTRSERQGSA